MGFAKRRSAAGFVAVAMTLGAVTVVVASSGPVQAREVARVGTGVVRAETGALVSSKGFVIPRPPQEYEFQMRASGEEQRVLEAAAKSDQTPTKDLKGRPKMRVPEKGGVGGSAMTSCPSPCYYFNGFAQVFTADPAETIGIDMTVGKPYVDDSVLAAAHSLGQVAVTSGDSRDIVEVGWMVDKTRRADGNPTLWAFHWIDSVPKGYDVAFVDYAPNPINLGAGLPKPVSKRFAISQTSTAWWVYYDTAYVAYVPKSRWTPLAVVRPFNAAVADVVVSQIFNEVAGHETEPCSDMGPGTMYDASGSPTPPVGTFVNYTTIGTATSPNLTTFHGDPGTPGVWGATQDTATTGRAGGPSYNSAGTGPGATGAC